MTEPDTRIGVVDRFGVIDIGSNSVRLVVFEGANRSPAYFYNEKVLCGLGLDLAQTGMLHPEGKERAILAIKRFIKITRRMRISGLRAVATEAVRAAQDGVDFCKQVQEDIGLNIEIISGQEEARLSAKGILLGSPNASGLMCDIGGASMELAELKNGQILRAETSKLGPMNVMGLRDDPKKMLEQVEAGVSNLVAQFGAKPNLLYLVGGSWRAMAQIHMSRTQYPLRVVHEYALETSEFLPTLDFIASADIDALKEVSTTAERRLNLLATAAVILKSLLEKIQPQTLSFSSYGLREGMLFDNMIPEVRKLDPLIEAARADESAQARFPGFGDMLFEWMVPLFPDLEAEKLRLIQAACLLHDVQWRSHPDYRGDVCFDSATHSNLGGIDHAGRVFLAWTLMHRYKVNRISNSYAEVRELITDVDFELAKTVGKAIRLGAMISSADTGHMGQMRTDDGMLHLDLPIASKELFGEVVQKRLEGLASAMGRNATVNYL